MTSLMDLVGDSITPEITSDLAARFGIPASGASSALKRSAATMLASIAAKSADQAFLHGIYALLTGSGAMAAASGVASATASPSTTKASEFLNQLFGSQLSNVQANIGEEAGIPYAAAGGILMTAAPMVISSLSHQIQVDGLDAAAFGTALASQQPGLRSVLSSGFAGVPSTSTVEIEETKGATGWLWSVLLAGALFIGGLVWFFSTAAQTTAETKADAPKTIADTAPGAFFKRKLAGGTELNIPENGIESKLAAFIEDPARPVDKTTWFDFDRLLFATGAATLEPSSNEQLANVAAILKAYPKTEVRIGGYTDNTGDPATNLKLSEDRADNVMAELVKLGVDPARMDAKGYGDQHPVAPNETEEGRAKNRRISLRVTEK